MIIYVSTEVKDAHSQLDIATRVRQTLNHASVLNMLDRTRDLSRSIQHILFIIPPEKREAGCI